MTRAYDVLKVEARWRAAWDRARCFSAPARPGRAKFFNYDSGPFPNGPLHLGHVRTYTLGDVVARFQRLRGRSVLYGTEWDAFGLPNEAAASGAGLPPGNFVRHWMREMERQLRVLGISYDWDRVRATCEPAYVRFTQWLFLELLRAGFVDHREVDAPWCPACATTVAAWQVTAGNCARCGTAVDSRRRLQWIVRLADDDGRRSARLDELTGWPDRVRRAVRALGERDRRSSRARDWVVSRQRNWGTPIPILHCERCGPVPVAAGDLPVGLNVPAGTARPCPACGDAARLDADTLDCFFDDTWCFLAALMDLAAPLPGALAATRDWMPVDHFHSGIDTAAYLPLHRFVAEFLHANGWLAAPEPIVRHDGNELVLKGGRKMSKHLGNAVAPDALLAACGADALRVAILWAASPAQAIEWDPVHVRKAERFLDRVHASFELVAALAGRNPAALETAASDPSAAARRFEAQSRARLLRALDRFEEYRPHAALTELDALCREADAFLAPRRHRNRLSAGDAGIVREAARGFAQALSPVAPHLAEELWSGLGEPPFVFQRRPICGRLPAEP